MDQSQLQLFQRPDVTDLLVELERRCFYGSLEIKFEAGRPVLLRKIENDQARQLSEQPR